MAEWRTKKAIERLPPVAATGVLRHVTRPGLTGVSGIPLLTLHLTPVTEMRALYLGAINNMPSDLRGKALTRLYNAVFLLASEFSSIEERLAKAYFHHLAAIHAPALPDAARERFERIRAELKAMYPTKGSVDGVGRDSAINLA